MKIGPMVDQSRQLTTDKHYIISGCTAAAVRVRPMIDIGLTRVHA